MIPSQDVDSKETRSSGEAPRRLVQLERRESVTEAGNEVLEIELRVPKDLLYFQGHFEGDPVLPGVVQLNEVALEAVEHQWPDLGCLERVRRLKFIQIIRPDDVITLRLERKKSTTVTLSITKDGEACTSAILLFTERGSP